MKQPPSFVHPQYPHHVCKLHKALYGLKQAPRAWFSRLSSKLLELGFHDSLSNTSLFISDQAKFHLYVLIYVDDIIITGSSSQAVDSLILALGSDFAVKNLGDLHYFLGIKAHRSQDGLFLCQKRYILSLLKRTNMLHAKPISSPMSTTHQLSLFAGNAFSDVTQYCSIVGALQYLSLTRPDISFAVNKVCQFMHRLTDLHWTAVKCILRYLKHSLDYGLLLRCNPSPQLSAFSNADWAGCPDDRCFTSGFCIFLGPNLIS